MKKNSTTTVVSTPVVATVVVAPVAAVVEVTAIVKIAEDARTGAYKARERFNDLNRQLTAARVAASDKVIAYIKAEKALALLAKSPLATDVDGQDAADAKEDADRAKLEANYKAFDEKDIAAYNAICELTKSIHNARLSMADGFTDRLGVSVKGMDKLVWVDCKEIKFSKALRGTTIKISYVEKDGKARDVKIIK